MQAFYRQEEEEAFKGPIQNSRSHKHPKAEAKKRAGRKRRPRRKTRSNRLLGHLQWRRMAMILLNLLRILAD
jgi:hypothetical protein